MAAVRFSPFSSDDELECWSGAQSLDPAGPRWTASPLQPEGPCGNHFYFAASGSGAAGGGGDSQQGGSLFCAAGLFSDIFFSEF